MPINKKIPISCDWSAPGRIPASGGSPRRRRGEKTGAKIQNKEKASAANKSRLYKHKGNFKWQGIKTERYKPIKGDWADIVRQTLIGSHGEKTKFHLRYFEIAPGGCSSFEKHRHEHVVVCVRGKGKALTGKKIHTMAFLDAIYIAPDTPHQLKNPFKEPFGFFCIVNAKRDKPSLLT